MKCVFVTNIPAPYREKVHEYVALNSKIDYEVLYCSDLESNRDWQFSKGLYDYSYLTSRSITFRGRDIYLFSNIWSQLQKMQPDVVVLAGFSLPMLVSYFWCLLYQKKIISFTDAHLKFERRLTCLHKTMRKIFYRLSDACIGASNKSLDLFRYYGVRDRKLFKSQLCANNEMYFKAYRKFLEREFDIILCGRICEEKLTSFSLSVLSELKKLKPDIRVLVVGDGPLRENLLEQLKNNAIQYEYAGFVGQDALPHLYSNAKLFLFPSVNDAWGVVANEACAAGTPVITCEAVGAAGELLLDSVNSFILPLNKTIWAQKALEIISDTTKWDDLSSACILQVSEYSYMNAGKGLVDAVEFSLK